MSSAARFGAAAWWGVGIGVHVTEGRGDENRYGLPTPPGSFRRRRCLRGFPPSVRLRRRGPTNRSRLLWFISLDLHHRISTSCNAFAYLKCPIDALLYTAARRGEYARTDLWFANQLRESIQGLIEFRKFTLYSLPIPEGPWEIMRIDAGHKCHERRIR